MLVAWLTLIATLLGLQALGLGFGFRVWWVGEARNWLALLQEWDASVVARKFWQIDSRNPLSPWWYILFQDFIVRTKAAFFILHLGISLLLGLASYLAVVGITAGRGRAFAASIGAVVAVFLATTKVDNIHWNFLGALVCSLLSVWTFAEFLKTGRSRAGWLAWSIVFWLVAVQTYTIQSGAMLAVGFLSFTQDGRFDSAKQFVNRAARAIADMMPYAIALLLFILVWRTSTAYGITETAISLDPSRALQSLSKGIWHQDIAAYAAWVRHLDVGFVIVALLILAPGFLVAQVFIQGDDLNDGKPIYLSDLARVFCVGICLVVPTFILESTSGIFPPGSRWTMLLQFWLPLLTLSVLALLVSFLPGRLLRLWTWRVATGCFVAGSIIITLAWNKQVIAMVAQERAFMVALEQFVKRDRAAKAEFPPHYLVKLELDAWGPPQDLSRNYTKTMFGRREVVTFRFLIDGPAPKVAFLPEGVANPEFMPSGVVPYSRVDVVAWDGKRMTRLTNADQTVFEGLPVEWKRSEPLP